MKKYYLVVLFLTLTLQAQNLDSLYNVLMGSRINIKNVSYPTQVDEKQPDKCSFGLRASIKEHFDEYSLEKQYNISEVMARPELSTSTVSPSGIFRIHYDESGTHQPEYEIQDLAIAFDSSYNFQVNILGYPEPPNDGNLGGDGKYDIYVLNLGGGLYGATTPEESIGNGKYLSYIEIDNSFRQNEGYNTYGLSAAQVTAAHEFHHAIQLGDYGFFDEDLFYHELTSTAFEEFVYDDVNDYYAYMYSYFRNTANKLEDNSGYNLAVWNIFLQEKLADDDPILGHKIVKRSWEYLVDNRAIVAVAKAMSDYNKSFGHEYNAFADWLYFTNDNAKAGEYFEEAVNYPSVKSTYTLDLDDSEKSLTIQSDPTSINYLIFTDSGQVFVDTIVAVFSNSDIYGSLDNGNGLDIQFTISNGTFDGATSINDTYYSKLSGESLGFIQSSYIINNELSGNEIQREEIEYAYPQPYTYESGSAINIPTHPDITSNAELKIYSSDMNLVYSGNETIFSAGNIVVRWNGLDDKGNQLASGVYVYITRADGKIKKGKLVILN
jgi:hypothetical protein